MLRGGAVVVDVFDKKNRRLASHGDLDDGQWHKVVINKSKRKLYLTIDNEETQSMKVRQKLRVRSLTYIGGVSRQMSLEERLVKDSLKGCIRNLHINNKYLDLAAGKPAQAIGQCLARIEPGAYFGGDAYAIYDDNFNIGDSLYVNLEFKTTQLNGVLVSLSDGTGAISFSIELHNGKVIVSVTAGRKEETVQAIKSSMSKYDLCDSMWHQVTVEYIENVVTLKVDMEDLVSGFGKSSPILNHSRHPLYIGGLPESAPKGSLQIRDNFKGCLRKLAINSRRLDWVHMVSLQNVLPDSCPSF
ncbi:laminin subunit alpha-1-like isoform X2 [Limulus polyphemus]|nr:laminin subunit alpha-1-like isoform X2 [Limulus polyphemus]